MDCGKPSFSYFCYVPEFAQTHVHWTGDAIYSSPLKSIFNVLFSFCPQSFSALGFFPKIWLFISGVQGIRASAPVPPMNVQGWFPLGLTVQGLSRVFFQHHSSKVSSLQCSAFFMFHLLHLYMTTGKTITLTIQIIVSKWCICLLICCLGLS